jgi:hypothetical protein
MQKKVTKSNRKIGKDYRNKQKVSRLKKEHRKRLKASRRRGKIAG